MENILEVRKTLGTNSREQGQKEGTSWEQEIKRCMGKVVSFWSIFGTTDVYRLQVLRGHMETGGKHFDE